MKGTFSIVLIGSFVVCVSSGLLRAAGATFEDFESASPGSLPNGAEIGDFTLLLTGAATGDIVASPFTNGGDNAFQFNGADAGGISRFLDTVNLLVYDDFQVTADFLITHSTSTFSQGARFMQVYGETEEPWPDRAEIIRLYWKPNEEQTGVTFRAGNGTSYYSNDAVLPYGTHARITITSVIETMTYDVKVELEDDTVFADYTNLGYRNLGPGRPWTHTVHLTFGDIDGYDLDGVIDNVSLDNIPLSLHPGDANGDGMVNLADLQILGDNWQSNTATWAQADFTDDGNVNLADLQILGDNWGWGTGSDVSFSEAVQLMDAAVPEPSAVGLLVVGALLMLQRRRVVDRRVA
ncbi:MAG: PEP-CTERM sorting domain-containing protein [Phycisphaeraceae bacterium]|nr:PEP-CTERM sorting domain-containing protein [Phycisphaeraceae bacterium]